MPYTGTSIVDYLKSINQPSDFTSRSKLATEKGITNYTGTAEQNTQLLNILKGQPVTQPTTQPPVTQPTAQPGMISPILSELPTETALTTAAFPPILGKIPTPIPSLTPIPSPVGEIAPTPTAETEIYTVVQGDTLWDLAQKYLGSGTRWKELGSQVGITTEEQARKLQIGTKLTVPKVPGSIIPEVGERGAVTSEEERQRMAQEEADRIREQQEEQAEQQREITTLTNQKAIQDLKAALGIADIERPPVPTFASDYEALRSERGLEAIESRLIDINKQIADTEASLRQGLYREEERLAPMEIIGTKQRELQRQAQEQLDTLNRSKAVLIDEYNVKINVIDNIMKLKQLDYNAAISNYNTQFAQAIQLQSLLMTMEDRTRAEENMIRDDARANLTVLMNATAGLKFEDMPMDIRTLIKQETLKAEYPTGMVEYLMSVKTATANDIIAHGTSKDATGREFVYMIEQNPTTGEISTKQVYTGGIATVAEKIYAFSSAQRGQLLGFGITNEGITSLQGYINQYGLDAALEATDLDEKEKVEIRKMVTGIEEVFINKEWLKKVFGEADLIKMARSKGYGKLFLTKRQEMNNYLSDLVEKIARAQTEGKSYLDILREEGFSI